MENWEEWTGRDKSVYEKERCDEVRGDDESEKRNSRHHKENVSVVPHTTGS